MGCAPGYIPMGIRGRSRGRLSKLSHLDQQKKATETRSMEVAMEVPSSLGPAHPIEVPVPGFRVSVL